MLDIASPLGGDVEEIGHFQRRKYVHNTDSKGGNTDSIFVWHHRLGAMLRTLASFKEGTTFSFDHFLVSPLGDDVDKFGHFKRRKYLNMVAFFAIPLGDDVETSCHFQRKEIRSHDSFFLQYLLRAMLR